MADVSRLDLLNVWGTVSLLPIVLTCEECRLAVYTWLSHLLLNQYGYSIVITNGIHIGSSIQSAHIACNKEV